MTIHRASWTFVLLLTGSVLYAQKSAVRNGHRSYEAMAYADAIRHYERASEEGAADSTMARKLAQSYMHIRDYRNAAVWYGRVVALPNATARDRYEQAQGLRAAGQVEKADEVMKTYEAMAATDSRVGRQMGATAYTKQLKENPILGCQLRNLAINTEHTDMSTGIHGNTVLFASNRTPDAAANRRHTWTDGAYLDLYSATRGTEGDLTAPLRMKKVDTRYHESNVSFAPDGKTMYFTRNNYSGGKKGRTAQGVIALKIYSRTKSGDSWENEQPFPFNSDAYSTGHPSLSSDGNTLYFASDMPGSNGGVDIWRCVKEGATWSKPTNLGTAVNTEGDEMFPFVDANGTLFFSSDGQRGLGGLDVLYAQVDANGIGAAPVNSGFPMNTEADDFSLTLDTTRTTGYLTSNRPGGKGDDDIYAFTLLKPLGRSINICGTARDAVTQEPIPGAQITLVANGAPVNAVISDADGHYCFQAAPAVPYTISGTASEYALYNTEVTALPDVDTSLVRDLMFNMDGKVSLLYEVNDAITGRPLTGVSISRLDVRRMHEIEKAALFITDSIGDFREELQGARIGDSIVFYIELQKEGYHPKKGYFTYKIERYGDIDIHKAMKGRPGIDLCMFALAHDEHKLACEHGNDASGLPEHLASEVRVWLVVSDARSSLPVEDVSLQVTERNDSGGPVLQGRTDRSGMAERLVLGKVKGAKLIYDIELRKAGYLPKVTTAELTYDGSGSIPLHEFIHAELTPADLGTDLGKAIDINPIYFDLNKSSIRGDAARELNKIVAVMKESPTIEISLGSHTDTRGTSESNLALSQRRASSSAAYIIGRGISKKRIVGKGLGETTPVNRCTEGVECTDEEHQLNRRTEFIIVKM